MLSCLHEQRSPTLADLRRILMKIKKLFQVLVLGGTTLGLGIAACGGDSGSNGNPGQQQTLPDGGTGNPGGPPGW
jgi:hypothetical protein